MEERTFGETLQFCWDNKVSIYDAEIANEVDFFFNKGEGHKLDNFEQLCQLASDAYLKVDTTTSLSQIVDSLRKLVVDEHRDINKITHHDIIDNIVW